LPDPAIRGTLVANRSSAEAAVARTPSRRHGALAALFLVPLLVGLVGDPAPADSLTQAPPADQSSVAEALAKPLTAAQLSRRLTREVYGYLPYWELDDAIRPYLRYDLLSTVSLFSFRYGADGKILDTTASARLTGTLGKGVIGDAHAAGVRVELAFSFSSSVAANDAFFANAAAQATAISSTLSLLAATGADGVNLDVERLSNASFPAYGAFAGALRKAVVAVNPAGRVTVATNGAGSGAKMAAAALANGADRAFLMGYSYRSSGTSPTGSNSPITRTDGGWSLSASLDEYERMGAPLDRVLLGLPYFGLSRPTVDGSLHSAQATTLPTGAAPCAWNPSTPTFFVRDQGRIPPGSTVGYDALEESAWVVNHDLATDTWCQTFFDTPRSLRAKHELAMSRGLAGIGMWALGYDQGRSGYWEAIAADFSVLRFAGSDRYGTAAAISAATYQPGVPVAFVATGSAPPDALAAGPVAARDGGPVLLVRATAVPPATVTELKRLRPARIVVLGGAGAVSEAVVAALRPLATSGRVDRIGGTDRYATAAALSGASFGPGAPVAYIATGRDFPDALGGSNAGGTTGGPVLLVSGMDIPSATAKELSRLKPAAIVVLGGPSAVSEGVANALAAYSPKVTRVAGPDRYATAAAISGATYAPDAPVAFVATGGDFPDALAGAPAAARQAGPLLLVRSTTIPAATLAELRRLKPRRIVVLGGSAAIGDGVLRQLRDVLANP
jgi:putative cell wall-binding protein/spore germination protein YaaH